MANTEHRFVGPLAAALSVGLFAAAAGAGTKTAVQQSNEPNHLAIVNQIYGASFVGSPGAGFSRGGPNPLSLVRSSDLGGSMMNATGANFVGADDSAWFDGVLSITARARFASYKQTFGYFAGQSAASPFVPLISVGGSGYGATGQVSGVDLGALVGDWRWGRAGDGSVFSSRASDNPDGMDHLVSYKVEGLNNGFAATWLLFFEDLRANQNSDWDYNDLVVEINVAARSVQVVPLPGAAALGAAGLGVLAGLHRRRR